MSSTGLYNCYDFKNDYDEVLTNNLISSNTTLYNNVNLKGALLTSNTRITYPSGELEVYFTNHPVLLTEPTNTWWNISDKLIAVNLRLS